MPTNRRDFIKTTAAASFSLPFMSMTNPIRQSSNATDELDISIFSKHLQFLDYSETGRMAAELGFDGVDLTVRPKGHVLPENVITDLPKAVRDIENAGSVCKMMTTSIESVDNQHDVDIIKTASEVGIAYYRAHWYKYLADKTMAESLEHYQEEIARLSELNRTHDIIGCYQNHAGTKIGASYWEIFQLLQKADQNYFGSQYDIRHATADSGASWTNGLELLKSHIKVIVLKDFIWGKVDGKWKPVNVPIGEGMVDFTRYFKLLKSYGLKPPVSLHYEYPLGGAEKGKYEITVDRSVVFDAMKRDLSAIRTLWKNA